MAFLRLAQFSPQPLKPINVALHNLHCCHAPTALLIRTRRAYLGFVPRDRRKRTKDENEKYHEPDPQLSQLAPLPGNRFRAEPPVEPRTLRPRHRPRRHSFRRAQVGLTSAT